MYPTTMHADVLLLLIVVGAPGGANVPVRPLHPSPRLGGPLAIPGTPTAASATSVWSLPSAVNLIPRSLYIPPPVLSVVPYLAFFTVVAVVYTICSCLEHHGVCRLGLFYIHKHFPGVVVIMLAMCKFLIFRTILAFRFICDIISGLIEGSAPALWGVSAPPSLHQR